MAFERSERFYKARDAWFMARVRQQTEQELAGVPRSRLLGSRLRGARWRPPVRGARPTAGLYGTVDPRLHQHMRRLAEELAPAITEAMDLHLSALAFRAWSDWPVGTGLSKSLLDIEYKGAGQLFLGRVVQRAHYWRYVMVDEGQAFRVLLANPGRALAPTVAADAYKLLRRRV